jgi:hypothetical protein
MGFNSGWKLVMGPIAANAGISESAGIVDSHPRPC